MHLYIKETQKKLQLLIKQTTVKKQGEITFGTHGSITRRARDKLTPGRSYLRSKWMQRLTSTVANLEQHFNSVK